MTPSISHSCSDSLSSSAVALVDGCLLEVAIALRGDGDDGCSAPAADLDAAAEEVAPGRGRRIASLLNMRLAQCSFQSLVLLSFILGQTAL